MKKMMKLILMLALALSASRISGADPSAPHIAQITVLELGTALVLTEGFDNEALALHRAQEVVRDGFCHPFPTYSGASITKCFPASKVERVVVKEGKVMR